jgi:quercetin dioxygenase-like cupin family protein
MKRLVIAVVVSFSLMLQLQVGAFAGDDSTHKSADTEKYQTPLPVPGYRSGMPDMVSEDDLEKNATSSYPAWYRGTGKGGSYKEDSSYFWTMAVGPKEWVDTGLEARYFSMGTMTFKPGTIYPIHSHPAWESYYVLEGEGTITKYDKAYKVKPGDFFFNRPYDVHSISNDSDIRPLKVIWTWWAEGGDGINYFKGGIPLLLDECWKDKETACMSMKPPRILEGSDRYEFMRHLEPKK